MHIFRPARSVSRVPWIAAATLAVLVGCKDLPTAPDVASAPPSVGLSTELLAAMHALLDDPFLHDVIAQADQAAQHTMQAVADGIAIGDRVAVIRALTHAQRELGAPSQADDVVARAALSLTLDAVQVLFDAATTTDPGTSDALANPKRSP